MNIIVANDVVTAWCIVNEDENPCWKGYEMIGMKDKGGKQVPNCVPISEEYDVVNEQDYQDFISYMK